MILRPVSIGRFQFAVLSALRAAQLIRGCTARVESDHKPIMTAQIEVAEGKVTQLIELPEPVVAPADLEALPPSPDPALVPA